MEDFTKRVIGAASIASLVFVGIWRWRKRRRLFISFDYDHDDDLRTLLVGQATNHRTPFEFDDWSLRYASSDWRTRARKAIQQSDAVVVICGAHTNTARGVAEELRIAREEGKPYLLLRGRRDVRCAKPAGAADAVIQDWSWEVVSKFLDAVG